MTHQVLNDDGEAINLDDPELSDLLQHPELPSIEDQLIAINDLPQLDPFDPLEVFSDLSEHTCINTTIYFTQPSREPLDSQTRLRPTDP